jgi:hypothetical protein
MNNEPLQYRILLALKSQLEKIKISNDYKFDISEVFFPKKNLIFASYPSIGIVVNDEAPDFDSNLKSYKSFPVVLIFNDGLTEDDTAESYQVRLRHVNPTIYKCLMTTKNNDLSVFGEYHITKQYLDFALISNNLNEVAITENEFKLQQNMEDPYQ